MCNQHGFLRRDRAPCEPLEKTNEGRCEFFCRQVPFTRGKLMITSLAHGVYLPQRGRNAIVHHLACLVYRIFIVVHSDCFNACTYAARCLSVCKSISREPTLPSVIFTAEVGMEIIPAVRDSAIDMSKTPLNRRFQA